jgi:rRNA maturation endonuclease Nob1
MRAVLDASAILEGFEPTPASDYVVPSSVVEEVSKGRAGKRMENLLSAGLVVRDPTDDSRSRVNRSAKMMGEDARLSRADKDVLALAMDLGVPAITDDYSIQNVAPSVGVETVPFKQSGIEEVWRWGVRCPGCYRWFEEAKKGSECPVCGTELRTARRR